MQCSHASLWAILQEPHAHKPAEHSRCGSQAAISGASSRRSNKVAQHCGPPGEACKLQRLQLPHPAAAKEHSQQRVARAAARRAAATARGAAAWLVLGQQRRALHQSREHRGGDARPPATRCGYKAPGSKACVNHRGAQAPYGAAGHGEAIGNSRRPSE
eukprot:scaffold140918_cov18-Tisochrysis_lutea.AAC.1